MNVLIVDDSDFIRKLVAKCISNEGYTPLIASGAKEALKILNKQAVDLILMDVEMPYMNGFELTQLIRKRSENWIPIIFLTSKTEDKYLAQGIESGGDDYLGKPIKEIVLAAKLKAMSRIVDMKSELNEANEKLLMLTQTDTLTGLVNRRGMRLAIKNIWEESLAKRDAFCVVFMDIDYFKHFNDGYGHQEGDKKLKQVATIIVDNIRQDTDIAVRYGGEEFILILPSIDLQGAIRVIHKIQDKLSCEQLPHAFRPDNVEVVTMSFGVSSSDLSTNISELIQQADAAMYKAKELGRNTYVNYKDVLIKEIKKMPLEEAEKEREKCFRVKKVLSGIDVSSVVNEDMERYQYLIEHIANLKSKL